MSRLSSVVYEAHDPRRARHVTGAAVLSIALVLSGCAGLGDASLPPLAERAAAVDAQISRSLLRDASQLAPPWLPALVGPDAGARVGAFRSVTPRLGFVHHRPHNLEAPIAGSRTAAIARVGESAGYVGLLDLVDQPVRERGRKVLAPVVHLAEAGRWFPFRLHFLPIQKEEASVARNASATFLFCGWVLANLSAKQHAPRHIERLTLGQDVGVADRDRPGLALHHGLDDIHAPPGRVMANAEAGLLARPAGDAGSSGLTEAASIRDPDCGKLVRDDAAESARPLP